MSIELDIDPLLILSDRIRTKEAVVGVVGLGYVGLPLLVAVANAGFPVVGFEANPEKVGKLQDGRSYLVDVTDSDLASVEGADYSTDPAILHRAEVILIAVPTPLTDHTPDLSLVRKAAHDVGLNLRPGRLAAGVVRSVASETGNH